MPTKESLEARSRAYVAIDLKSFYASVECVERGLDPLDTCLVVADSSRSSRTICLAVSPALKKFGTGGRPRLFEVERTIGRVNRERGRRGSSWSGKALAIHPDWQVDYIVAPPRMAKYIEYSSRIYGIYLRYVAPEDIHVYSVDEVFIDVTPYLALYGMTAHDLAIAMIRTVLAETGITATAGISTNLYLAKVAMDIVAKNKSPDADGVRIAEIDEASYRRLLWGHAPLTDFWRIGSGVARRLARHGIFTMGDLARFSMVREEALYREFGVNAELLIDHAWGREPVTMAEIKAYRPIYHSISNGQVLPDPYPTPSARIAVLEAIDTLALELLDKRCVTDGLTLYIGYDNGCSAHGSTRLPRHTSSVSILSESIAELFDRIVVPGVPIRRLSLSALRIIPEERAHTAPKVVQLDLFTDYDELRRQSRLRRARLDKERRGRLAVLGIRKRFGRNAILRGLNFAEGATQRIRNTHIGGHHE